MLDYCNSYRFSSRDKNPPRQDKFPVAQPLTRQRIKDFPSFFLVYAMGPTVSSSHLMSIVIFFHPLFIKFIKMSRFLQTALTQMYAIAYRQKNVRASLLKLSRARLSDVKPVIKSVICNLHAFCCRKFHQYHFFGAILQFITLRDLNFTLNSEKHQNIQRKSFSNPPKKIFNTETQQKSLFCLRRLIAFYH